MEFKLLHTIETCDNAEDPTWYTIITSDQAESWGYITSGYGRSVLHNWIRDEQVDRATDEYGNPYLRALVHFDGTQDRSSHGAVSIAYSNDLGTQPEEIVAVETARDTKLYARHLDARADDMLEQALIRARASGHGANALARRVAGAISRPVALRMMRDPETKETEN